MKYNFEERRYNAMVLLELSDEDMLNLMNKLPEFYDLKDQEWFWKLRYIKKYRSEGDKPYNVTWKEYYLKPLL